MMENLTVEQKQKLIESLLKALEVQIQYHGSESEGAKIILEKIAELAKQI